MIGQDPYHGPGQAHGTRLGASLVRRNRANTKLFLTHGLRSPACFTGLCFSVPQGVQVPPSLRNVSRAFFYSTFLLLHTPTPPSPLI